MQQAILCFLIRDDEILLAESNYRPDKKTWNGITGFVTDTKKLDYDTSKILFDAIKVRTYASDLKKVGVMHLYTISDEHIQEKALTQSIFICKKWQGEPRFAGNFRPRWYTFDTIPYDDMFEDTKEWLPKIIDGEKLIIEILSQTNDDTHKTEVRNVNVRSIFE
ncbi:hypothetical protein BH09PAT1_BH09PAT1_6760 [soil metagenome]